MALQNLNEELHSRDFHDSRGESSPYDPRALKPGEATHPEFTQTEKWHEPELPVAPIRKPSLYSRLNRKQRLTLIWGSAAFVLTLIVMSLFVTRGMFFSEENIHLGINGPASIESATKTEFSFTYVNGNWSAIEDVTLVLTYPETFQLEPQEGLTISRSRAEVRLGDIGAREEGTWRFAGIFSGFQGDLAYLKASLRYSPAGLSSSFTKEVQLPVQVAASPLIMELAAPREVSNGQEIVYVVDYRNEGSQSFSNLRLQMEYPAGFRFLSSFPPSSEGEGIWYIETLTPGQREKITIRGILSGSQNENKKVRALLGRFENNNFLVQNIREQETAIKMSPLTISQTVNGLSNIIVNAGDNLLYRVTFRNEGSVGLRDGIVTVELDSPYLDYAQLSLPSGGVYDQSRKIIMWKASDVPTLAKIEPGGRGEVSFSIPVLRTFTRNSSETNLFVKSVAKIDSLDLPTSIGANKVIGSNTLLVKLNSLVISTLTAFYYDQTFPNTGPLPPVVGKETTYTVHVRIANTLNDISRARLVLALPTGVDYKEKFSPSAESVSWNERANELIWEIGVLSPGKDRELVFQVGAVPGPNEVDKSIVLINGGTLTGLDTYTKEEVKLNINQKENYIPEDSAAEKKSHKVKASE